MPNTWPVKRSRAQQIKDGAVSSGAVAAADKAARPYGQDPRLAAALRVQRQALVVRSN